jgi:hypothetical protein
MSWELDTPQFPLKKSATLEKLEQLHPEQLNAMDRVEIDEHIEDIAYGFAKAYHKKKPHDFDTCLTIVSAALKETGGALGGKFGAIMVGTSQEVAEKVCKVVFDEENN